MSKVSVIIPAYNCAAVLPQSVDSVFAQTEQDFEVLIVNDGSTDATREVIDSLIRRHGSRIRVFDQPNQGLAVARNTGLRNAKGEMIALLDADDVWLPMRLEITVRTLESDRNVGLAHANIQRISASGELLDIPIRDQRFLSGAIFEHILLRRAHVACPTVLFRRECCEKAGMFDENLTRLGCEDRDLWLRIARHYPFKYLDLVLAYYRVSPGSMSQDQEKMMKARIYVIDKFCPADDRRNRGLRARALARIYQDQGDEMLIRRKFPQARKHYRQALGFDPTAFRCWAKWGQSFLRMGGRYVS